MEREVLEITITREGELKVHVKGKKGPRCLDYRDLFREILGAVNSPELTDEYYEEENVIVSQGRVKNRRG